MKETIIELLSEISDETNLAACTDLIDGGVLSSLDIIQLISALNDEYDISIPAGEIVPKNFNSAKALYEMVQRLQEA